MILSRVRQLRAEKETAERRKISYAVMSQETGLAPSTLVRLMRYEPLDRIDGATLETLCEYFNVGIGDVLKRAPAARAEDGKGK